MTQHFALFPKKIYIYVKMLNLHSIFMTYTHNKQRDIVIVIRIHLLLSHLHCMHYLMNYQSQPAFVAC